MQKPQLFFSILRKGSTVLQRILSPDEQFCLTEDAQALIYKYSSSHWLSQRQLEDLITEAVVVSKLRHTRADASVVNSILEHIGDPLSISLENGPAAANGDLHRLPS